MKHTYILLLSAITFLFACNSNGSNNLKQNTTSSINDTIAITTTLHNFFTWYKSNEDRLNKIKFTTDTGKHIALNEAILSNYLNEIKKSGFISDGFVQDEIKFYKACASTWQTQPKDAIIVGLQMDRIYCAFDYIAPYNTGKVAATIKDNTAEATLTIADSLSSSSFVFNMVKQNNDWLIDKLGCDMGIKY